MMSSAQFQLQNHVDARYANQPRQLPFRSQSVDAFNLWQQTLRRKILELLEIDGRLPPKTVEAELLQSVDRGDYIEEKYALDVGESVRAPLYILVPKTPPPYKALLAFHGHDPSVQNILGNYPDEQVAQHNLAEAANWAQVLAQVCSRVWCVVQQSFRER